MKSELIKSQIKRIRSLYKFIIDNKILYDIEVIFLMLLPILITLDKYIGIAGTILTGIPFIIGILSVLLYQKKSYVKYLIIFVLLFINAFIPKKYSNQFEFVKPLLIFFTTLDMVRDEDFLYKIKMYLKKYSKFITISIIIVIIANFLSIFFSNENYSKAWKMDAFEGLYQSPHQAAYRICALIIYIMFLIKFKINNKILNLGMFIISEVLLLKTGARTPTLLGAMLGIITLYFMKDELIALIKKNKKMSCIIGVLVIIVLAIYLPNTAFMQKMIVSSKGTFDNGRNLLNTTDWNYFLRCNLFNKLFGNDIDNIRQINKQVIYAPIWCHNDIMQVLLQFGIFMLAIYLITIIKAMILHLKDENKFSKIIIILLNLVYIFVAFYNGLFFFPRFIVAIPIIFTIYKIKDKEESEEEKYESVELISSWKNWWNRSAVKRFRERRANRQ